MKINNGICAPHSTPHPDSLIIFAELQFQIRRAPVSAQQLVALSSFGTVFSH
jgi:hypothetical protein